MLRAVIADQTLELVGCDTMRHSDKFAAFSCDGGEADFHITVKVCEQFPLPAGTPVGVNGNTRWLCSSDTRGVLYHVGGHFMLDYDFLFSDVTLTLKRGLENADKLHYLYVTQCFSYYMLGKNGCSLHSTGLMIGQSGVALAGPSGIGKSTMAMLLENADDRVTVLSEDVPALTQHNDGWQLHGTPFCGDDERCRNESVPLKAIIMLKQGDDNRLTALSAKDALFGLLARMPRPVYCEALGKAAVLRAERLQQQVPIFQFENNATAASARMLLAELSRRSLI